MDCSDDVKLSLSQEESLQQLTCEINPEITLEKLGATLSKCTNFPLQLAHIQLIDAKLHDYALHSTDKVKLGTYPEDNMQKSVGLSSDVLRALIAYHQVLLARNFPLTLTDVMGYLLFSAKLVQVILECLHAVSTHTSPQPTDAVKSLWMKLNESLVKLVSMIDKYESGGSCDSLCSSMQQLITSLAQIGKELTHVVPKAVTLVYKCVVRLVTKWKEYRSTEVLSSLVDCITHTTLAKLSALTSPQGLALIKLISFLLRLLSKLVCLESEEVEVLWMPVVDVMLNCSHHLLSRMYGETGNTTGDDLHLAFKSLVNSSLSSHIFSSTLMKHVSTNNRVGTLYVLCTVHECLTACPSLSSHWWRSHRLPLCNFLSSCARELCGIDARQRTPYGWVVSKLSGAMVAAAGVGLEAVEELLLTLTLSPAVHVSLLGADCWHVLAIHAPPHLLLTHSTKLLRLTRVPGLTHIQISAIQTVVLRLTHLMSSKMQETLVRNSGASCTLLVDAPLSKQAREQLLHLTSQSLVKQLGVVTSTRSSGDDVVFSLSEMSRSLDADYQGGQAKELSAMAADSLLEILSVNLHNKQLESVTCVAVNKSSLCRRYHSSLLKLLVRVEKDFDVSLGVLTAAVDSLSHLTTLPTRQEKDVVVRLFQRCLSSSMLTLKLHALDSFKKFAQFTPYQELIGEVVHSPHIAEDVRVYCRPQDVDGSSAPSTYNWQTTPSHKVESMEEMPQPRAKRRCVDVDEAISSLQQLVREITDSKAQLTSQHRNRLLLVSSQLSSLV